MEIAGLNVGNYIVSKLFGDDEVKINCGAADLENEERRGDAARVRVRHGETR